MVELEKKLEKLVSMMEEMRAENKAIAERLGIMETEKKWAGNAA